MLSAIQSGWVETRRTLPRMKTLRRPDPERLHALTARLKLWLLEVCVWLSEWLGRKLPREVRMMMREDMRKALSGARLLVFLLAISRCRDAPLRVLTERPSAAPPGFRRTGAFNNDMRNVSRAVRLRGRTIAARLAELRDVLDNPGAWAQRALKRLLAGPHGARLMLCWMRAARVQTMSVLTPAFADTS